MDACMDAEKKRCVFRGFLKRVTSGKGNSKNPLCTSSAEHSRSIMGRMESMKAELLQIQGMSMSWQPVEPMLEIAAVCFEAVGETSQFPRRWRWQGWGVVETDVQHRRGD